MSEPPEKPLENLPDNPASQPAKLDPMVCVIKVPEYRLPPTLEPLAKREVELNLSLLDSYKKVYDRAVAGERISGEDYTRAEEPFNAQFAALQEEVTQAIKEKVKNDMTAAETPGEDQEQTWLGKIGNAMADAFKTGYAENKQRIEYEQTVEDRTLDLMYPIRKDNFEGNPAVEALENPAPLNEAFKKHYIDNAAHRKNTQLDPSTDTKEKLLVDLLSKNRGIAIGECHDQQEAMKLMTDNMGALKTAGLDTIYTEFPEKDFNSLSRMSLEELKQMGQDRIYRDEKGNAQHIPLPEKDERGAVWDDVTKQQIDLLVAARESGVRIVNMDKKGQAREFEADSQLFDHRVASTNFIWCDNIEKDRKALADQGQPDGKFIAWGGQGHFLNNRDEKGLVDEGLGVPLVVFVRGNEKQLPPFVKGPSANGADFYLPGGSDHYDTFTSVLASDVQDAAQKVKGMDYVPGFVPSGLEWLSDALDNMAGKSLDCRPMDVPVEEPVPAPATPTPSQPPTSRSR